MGSPVTRREFFAAPAVAAAVPNGKLAIRGGTPVRTEPFPSWPRTDALDENALLATLRGGDWCRTSGKQVDEFEKRYAALTGARYCLATANGTSALLAGLGALEVGPGDEVILSPYTFVATVNAVLVHHALPVFADTDPETQQIDARTIASRITDRTAAIIPVHLGGSAADLDAVLAIARERKLPVLEDACQAHLAEWRGKKVGTVGDAGCFSFQASKNLNSGEGGALLTNREDLMSRAYSFHTNGRPWKGSPSGLAYTMNGANLRLTEFQASLLMTQMTRIEGQSQTREKNAAYLTQLLNEIPGIHPARLYDGCTRCAWHLYMLRYDADSFAGVPRAAFLKALAAEGVPASGGYSPLNREAFLDRVLASRHYSRIYGDKRLRQWREQNECPANDKLCREAVWFYQTMLLGSRRDMEQIAEAVAKIRRNAADLREA
jgi:perosamine synthetase